MHHCLNLKASTSSSATGTQPTSSLGEGNSSVDTPRTPGTNVVASPTVNLSREYALAVQSSSYSEIWSKIHVVEQRESDEPNHHQQLLLTEVLQPNHDFVQEALKNATPSYFIQLVSAYFEHSEKTCHLLLLLHHSIQHARSLYAPVHDLVEALPVDFDSITQLQCNHAFDVFLQFEQDRNPFPCPDSHNFQDMRSCFSQLKQEVDLRLHKSRVKIHRARCVTTSSALCLIGTVVGVTIAAVAIATHALVAVVAAFSCPVILPSCMMQKEIVHMGQLDAAARSAYVMHNDLDTIDRLVSRVHTAIEDDKLLIRLGLDRDRDRDKHPVYEVVKQLRKNRINLLDQLTDLEEHICLCFAAINRARSLLLQEIEAPQS